MAIMQFLSAISKLDKCLSRRRTTALPGYDIDDRQKCLFSSACSIWNYFLASSCRALSAKRYPGWSNWRRSNGPTLVSGILVRPFSAFVCTYTYIRRNFHLHLATDRTIVQETPFQVQLTLPESLNTRMNIERTFIFICDLQISQQSRPRRRITKLGYYDLDDTYCKHTVYKN